MLREATRTFSIRADQARTLKDVIFGRRASAPARVAALQDASLHVQPGETVGMIGRNGAGKTSTLKILAGIVPLESGEARCGGRIVSLLELGAGFSRDFSGRENIYLQGALFGFERKQIEERLERIVAFSEIGHFIDVPVKTYSQGMFLRLGFSIAAHLDADVMLIDEVLAVGDEAFQRKCLRRISELIAGGATVLLVSHELAAIERVCERVIVLDGGRIVFDGPTTEGLLHYRRLSGTEHGGGESVRPRGLRAVDVVDLELRDAASRSSSVFHSGAPLQVLVTLRAEHAPADPRLTLELSGEDGSCLFRTQTPFDLRNSGTAALVFDIPQLALLGGDYDLAVGAGGADQQTSLQRSVRFSVAHEPGAEGVVALHGSWRALAGTEGVR